MQIAVTPEVAALFARLRAAGVRGWLVGGAVRDSLAGRPVADWDMAVECAPPQLARALPGAKPIGGRYGTVNWHGVEVTPCRREGAYSDGRHPDEVVFGGTIEEDLARRDFTVNAMAWDGERLLDPWKGEADLRGRVLRCVGDPHTRFAEDALRVLRLFRFASVLGFDVEWDTFAAACEAAPELGRVSAQRVRDELNRALTGQTPAALAPLVAGGGLASFGIGPSSVCLGFLGQVPGSLLCRWWALLHATGSDAALAARVFGFGRSFQADYGRLDALYSAGAPQGLLPLKRSLAKGTPFDYRDIAETFAALDARWSGAAGLYTQLLQSREPYKKEQLAVTSAQLMAEGVPPRKLGAVQAMLLKAVVEQPALNEWPTLVQMARSLCRFV